jgi:hypothetical protein
MSEEHIKTCKLCSYSGKTDLDLKYHNETSHSTVCRLCNYLGKSELDLEMHVDALHSNIFTSRTFATMETKDQKSQPITKTGLIKNNQKRKQETEPVIIQKKRKIECAHCLKPYINLESLRTHTDKKHPEETNSLTVCNRLLKAEVGQNETNKKLETFETGQNQTNKILKAVIKELDQLKNIEFADMRRKMTEVIQSIDVSQKIEIAKIETKQAQCIDKDKENILRMGGFKYRAPQTCTSNENLTVKEKQS